MKPTLISLALVAAFPLFAQEGQAADNVNSPANEAASVLDAADASSDGIELADTVVRPDYIEIERLANTKEIIVIGKEQLQQQGNRTMTDALRKVPSITVGATGMNQIDIRGQGSATASTNLQVLIDGAPITSITSHPFSMSYDVVPVEQLERIEVIPGGGSVMYGSGAVGGIVSMTSSLQAMKEPRSTLWGEWNSKGYRTGLTAGTTFADNRGAVEFSASKLDRDLYFKNTFAKTEYYSVGARWNLTPKQQILLRASHMDEESQYVGTIYRDKLRKFGRDYDPGTVRDFVGVDDNGDLIEVQKPNYIHGDKKLDMLSLTYRGEVTDTLELINDLYYDQGYYKGLSDETQKMDIKGYGLRSKANWKYAEGAQLLMGLDLLHQTADLNYDSFDYVSGVGYMAVPYAFHYQKDTYALFALNTNRWGKWEVNEGARYEIAHWSFDKRGQFKNGEGKSGADRRNMAFDLSVAYLYSDAGRVYARYERGYTLPDGLQIADQIATRDPVTRVKSKHLEVTQADDEHYDMFEVGWRHAFPWTTANITLWYNKTENQLSRYYDLSSAGLGIKSVNLFNTERWGADISFSQKIWNLTFEESYAYTMGRTTCHDLEKCAQVKQNSEFTDKGLQKVPKHKVVLRANWDITDKLSTDVTYLYQGKYTNFTKAADEDDGFMEGYGLTNIGLKYRPNDHWQIYAGVNNVFDKEYFEYGSAAGNWQVIIPGAERQYYVGVKAIW